VHLLRVTVCSLGVRGFSENGCIIVRCTRVPVRIGQTWAYCNNLFRFGQQDKRWSEGPELEHTQQRLPQVLKPETEYATFAYVEHAERPPIFLIQKSPPRCWSYQKQGLHRPEMCARRWGMRS